MGLVAALWALVLRRGRGGLAFLAETSRLQSMLRCLVVAPNHSAELVEASAQKGCACFAYFVALGAPMVARMVRKVRLHQMVSAPLGHTGLALLSHGVG